MRRIRVSAQLIEQTLLAGTRLGVERVIGGLPLGSKLINATWDPDRREVLLDFDVPGTDPHSVEDHVLTFQPSR